MRIATLGGILCLSLIRIAAGQSLSAEVLKFVKVNAPLVALTHVRVVDGTGAAAAEDQTLILSAGKIASIAASATAKIPKQAQVMDLGGYTVIPGLVGMHEHLFYPIGDGIYGEMGRTGARASPRGR